MNFIINREKLIENLNTLQKAIPSKTSMPVLLGIKVDVYQDKIVMITSNNEMSIKTEIIDSSVEIKEVGNFIIPGSYFINIIKKLDSKTIEMELIENTIVIKSNRSEFKLNSLSYDDYPNIEFIEGNSFLMSSKMLKNIIKVTNYSTSLSERRPVLTGVNLNNVNNNLNCVSTDSFRLSKYNVELEEKIEDFNITIPSKTLSDIEKIIDNYQGNIKISIYKSKILFNLDNIMYQSVLLEGNYPDVSNLIPKDFPIVIKFNKEELLGALDRVSLLSPKEKDNNINIIKFSLKKNQVVEISSTDDEIGKATEEIIPTDTVIGSQININFSSKYLLDALKSFVSNEITISFTGDTRPFVIKGEYDGNLVHMILPVRPRD